MIPYGRQSIDQKDIDAVVEVLKSDFLTQGPGVLRFEESLKEVTGASYAVAVNSATSALHLAYLASGIKSGDEVITTPNTFVATTNMLLAIGAVPVFCDINLETHNIDEEKIESHITPRTKAIIAVDFSGKPCNYNSLREIAKKRNLVLISDAAHSLGATFQGENVGTLADVTTVSFHPVKPITTAEGGALLTNNEDIYKKALLLRSHGVEKNESGLNVMTELGFNYRLPDVLAALGTSQLNRLSDFIEKRRKVASWYEESLSSLKEIIRPQISLDSGWHLYVIRTSRSEDQRPLYKHLIKNGIGANFHYPAVYSHPYYRDIGYKNISLDSMELYQKTAITLPCHTLLERKDVTYICESIRIFYE